MNNVIHGEAKLASSRSQRAERQADSRQTQASPPHTLTLLFSRLSDETTGSVVLIRSDAQAAIVRRLSTVNDEGRGS